MARHNELGKWGEKVAAEYLMKQGYKILARNYHYQKAEVDILAQQGKFLAAVEVKTRTSTGFGDPEEFLKPSQIKRLVRVVDFYVVENSLDLTIRFDVIAIVKNLKDYSLEHIEDAFYFF